MTYKRDPPPAWLPARLVLELHELGLVLELEQVGAAGGLAVGRGLVRGREVRSRRRRPSSRVDSSLTAIPESSKKYLRNPTTSSLNVILVPFSHIRRCPSFSLGRVHIYVCVGRWGSYRGRSWYTTYMPRLPDERPQFPRQHKLSDSAARALYDFKAELQCWDAYLESCTTSVVIELLTWYWREVRREGKTEVSPLKFRPQTRVGRKAGRHEIRNARRVDPELPPG